MSESKSTFPDENIFKKYFRLFCKIWIWVSVILMILVCSVWFIIMISALKKYDVRYGFGHQTDNPYFYGGSSYCGYADQTPFPKHLAGVTFAGLFEAAMIIWILLSIMSELSWMGGFFRRLLVAFRLKGLYSEVPENTNDHVIVNAMLKVFIGTATGAQSWLGAGADDQGVQQDFNVEKYCLWVTIAFLVNILPSIVAQMYYCPDEIKRRKADNSYA